MVKHLVTIDGPPKYQAYGARCLTCGWVGPVQILKVSAEMNAETHVDQQAAMEEPANG